MSHIAWNPLLASTILVLALGDPTAACSCAPQHPQMAFCQADAVIRGRFVGVTELNLNSSTGASVSWVRYEIKVTKVYKGFEPLRDAAFVDTPALESVCGYRHPEPLKGEEYLIMALRQDERLIVSTCSFLRPWTRVPLRQRRGISQVYAGGCTCNVVPCNSMPCVLLNDDQCLWTDGLLDRSWRGHQAEHLACLPRPNKEAPPGAAPFCGWETLKSSLPGALVKTAKTRVQ